MFSPVAFKLLGKLRNNLVPNLLGDFSHRHGDHSLLSTIT
jgi:hypothetical protein